MYKETPVPYPIPSANKPNRQRSGGKPVGATLHWMVGYLAGTDAHFRNPATGYATNEGIGTLDRGATWEIHQYVPENEVAWGNGNTDLNDRSESIELANDLRYGATSTPPPEVHELVARRLAALAIRYDWRINGKVQLVLGDFPGHDFYSKPVPGFGVDYNVITHRSVALKDCPGTTDVRAIVARGNQIIAQKQGLAPEEDATMYPIQWNKHLFTFGKQYVKHETNGAHATFTRNVLTADDKFIVVDDAGFTALCESFGIPWDAVDQVLKGSAPGQNGKVWSRELESIELLRELLGKPAVDPALVQKTIEDAIAAAEITATVDVEALADAVVDEQAARLTD
jgi:hypothetical protein